MDRTIATKTGDDGTTSLMFGTRVSKDSLRVETYGTVDELNAMLGLARAHCEQEFISKLILHIQQDTFIVASELATLPDKLEKLKRRVDEQMLTFVDEHVKTIETKHKYTMDWAMPGDHPGSAALDVARTVCRRTERLVVKLYNETTESYNHYLVKYLNRLSDLLWLMARWQDRENNATLTSVREFLNNS